MSISQLFKTAPVTTLLLVSFIGLFVIQIVTGVDANNPSTQALLHWGANALPFTMGDEPWRLVSSGFLHIGLMHLLFNSFAMYFFGQIAEPLLGSFKFLVLFLLAVVGGNVLNTQVTWQAIIDGSGQPGLSAGASGGIMGIGAALLVAAFFKMSVNGLMLNLKSLLLIMGINLVYGFAVPGIDNAGHIGGAITGLLIALPIALVYRQRMRLEAVAHQAAMVSYQSHYDNNLPLSNIFADNNTQIPVNLENNTPSYHDGSHINSKAIVPKDINMNPMWQLLSWLTMLAIALVFVWWWQDIHNQILQILAGTP